MTLQELIRQCEFAEVSKKLLLHYPDCDIDEFERLYAKLKSKAKITAGSEFTLLIRAFGSDGGDDDDPEHLVTEYDEDDTSLYFDVSAEKAGEPYLYSIAGNSFDDFLAMNAEEETLRSLSPASILAHSLYEITFFGFDDSGRQ